MKCPVCRQSEFPVIDIGEGLMARRCSECGGTWIPSANYHAWRQGSQALTDQSDTSVELEIVESQAPKLCPETGHILVPYRVGHGASFALDHCGECNGVWCDRNEWEALKSRNLHGRLHHIFTAPWQRQIREEEHRAATDRLYSRLFGEENYAELRRIRDLIAEHPNKHAILAFLSHPITKERGEAE